jgi:hypothetical protein
LIDKVKAKDEDIQKVREEMFELFKRGGIDAVLDKYSEIIAFQAALTRLNRDMYEEIHEALRRMSGR